MELRTILIGPFLLLNVFACLVLLFSLRTWIHQPAARRWSSAFLLLAIILLNLPLLAFYAEWVDLQLIKYPSSFLQAAYLPSAAWLITLIIFFLVAAPLFIVSGMAKGWQFLASRFRAGNQSLETPAEIHSPSLTRRKFIAGSAGLLIPAIYGGAAYSVYGTLGDIDVSKEIEIPIPHLPRSLDGMTIVQVSDFHVGPYIRQSDLERVVQLVQPLRPDLIALTGDLIDSRLFTLPEALNGLRKLQAPLGVFNVLGNHDIYADSLSFTEEHRGGVKIVEGLDSIGIRTLRNEVVRIGSGQDQLSLLGLDWLNSDPRNRNFYRYPIEQARNILIGMAEQAGPETPKVLLTHHPDMFTYAHPLGIGLSLAGHTHGGGQIVLGYINGRPLGVSMLRFRYLSGLYQEQGCSLYVNRGIGFLGVPIRLNSPPEISRFKLVLSVPA